LKIECWSLFKPWLYHPPKKSPLWHYLELNTCKQIKARNKFPLLWLVFFCSDFQTYTWLVKATTLYNMDALKVMFMYLSTVSIICCCSDRPWHFICSYIKFMFVGKLGRKQGGHLSICWKKGSPKYILCEFKWNVWARPEVSSASK